MEFTCKQTLIYEDINQTACGINELEDFFTICGTIEDLLYYLFFSDCEIKKVVIGDGFDFEVLMDDMKAFAKDLPTISSEELQQIHNMLDIYAPFGLIEYIKIARKKQNKSIPKFYILTTGSYYTAKNIEDDSKLIELCKKYNIRIFFKTNDYNSEYGIIKLLTLIKEED